MTLKIRGKLINFKINKFYFIPKYLIILDSSHVGFRSYYYYDIIIIGKWYIYNTYYEGARGQKTSKSQDTICEFSPMTHSFVLYHGNMM